MAPLATQNKATIFMTGKPAPGFWDLGWGQALIFWRVRQPGGGAVQRLEPPALQTGGIGRPAEGRLRDVQVNALHQIWRDQLARLAIGRAVFSHGPAVEREQHIDLFHDFPAGRVALQNLPQPTPEGAVQRQEPVAAVALGRLVVQAPGREDGTQARLNLGEGRVAERLQRCFNGTGSQGRQHRHQLREVTGHKGGIYTALLTKAIPFFEMTPEKRQTEYQALRQQLSGLGWISEGYAQNRGRGAGGPCFQWTRKVKGKTVSVALSEEQFDALTKAIKTWKKTKQIIKRMQQLSREEIFTTLPGIKRSKQLSKKVLGLI